MAISYPPTYFNRFDPLKNYKRLVFLSGNGLQAAELNEIQDLVLWELRKISTFLISNGTVVSGGEINNIDIINETAHILAAEVFADGNTITVAERSTIPIDAMGVSIIGVAVVETLITDMDDPEIREQDQASKNFGSAGAYRLSKTGVWKASTELAINEVFYPVVTVVEGQTSSFASDEDSTSLISNLIGNYDYETNGSYILNGFVPRFNQINGQGKYVLDISSGKARVLGTIVPLNFAEQVELDGLDEKKTVNSANFTWQTGVFEYPLGHNSVATVFSATGVSERTVAVTHGPYSGATDFIDDALISITEVRQGATVYTEVVDYNEAQGGVSIDWSPAGDEPAPSSTYDVTYKYINIVTDPTEITVNGTNDGVSFPGASELFLNDNIVIVSYEYYLSRTDRISLNSAGEIVVQKGTPGYYYFFAPPKQENLLSLATIMLRYGAVSPNIEIDTTFNFTYDQITDMVAKISTLEYNVAQLSLLDDARQTDPTTNKQNLIVDPLYDNDLRDKGIPQTFVIIDDRLNIGSNLQLLGTYDQNYTLNYTPVVELRQEKYSDSRKINPYAVAGDPAIADIEVVPHHVNVSRQILWNDFTEAEEDVLLEDTDFTVKLSRFSASEQVTVTFHTFTPTQVIVDGNGEGEVILTAPKGLNSGAYSVKAVGGSSGAEAVNTLTISVTVTRDMMPPEPPPPPPVIPRRDPVSQSFSFDKDCVLTSVSFYVTELPTQDILVRLVRVRVGLPDTTDIIGFGRVPLDNVSIGWNTCTLDYLTPVIKGIEYALVIFTNTIQGSVGVAKVGNFDQLGSSWISSQAASGVFFISPNLSTWTPVNDEDLTYRITRADFLENRTVTLISALVSNVTDWYLTGSTNLPIGTGISYFMEFTNEFGNPESVDISLEQPLYTKSISGAITLKANLTTTNLSISPVGIRGLRLYGGTPNAPGTYYMRVFQLQPDTDLSIKAVMNIYEPSGAVVTCGTTLDPTGSPVFHSMPRVGTPKAIGDGWFEVEFEVTSLNITSLINAQFEVVGTLGPDSTARPQVARIRILIQ